jgi:hypothetical protein
MHDLRMIVETCAKHYSCEIKARARRGSRTRSQTLKGEVMKNYARILVAAVLFLGLSGAAKAATQDGIVVKLPFEFVAGGKTLPAGTYTVRHWSDDISGPLILTSRENGSSVFVLPYVSDHPSGDKPQVSFQRVGELRFLSTIQTTFDTYQIHVSHSAIMEATAKLRNSVSATGGSGNE